MGSIYCCGDIRVPPPLRLPGATVFGGGALTVGATLLPSPMVLGAAFVPVVAAA